ncbi:MAG TPA: cobaltochelatase subunit CobN, partial [Clostridia bacterium]|nr:cobaltochelatase subunit CobN [Clostridia bacterium]
EITDLDHYYEFFGGLAKSVEMAKGQKARMLITDTTGERIETEGVEKSIARGIRTRVLNPKWIDGMLAHPQHGAQKIADRFENLMGLAATTNQVDEWIYNDLDKRYVEDEDLRRRMAENNPHAYMKILQQMMEYQQRGYWN